MADPAPTSMTVETFLAWSESWAEGERYELVDGAPVAMSPETNRHVVVKAAVATELARAVDAAGVACTALPDGPTVVVDESSAFEPDAVVTCAPLDLDAVTVANPVILVEVLSPSSRAVDTNKKLTGYFSLSSVRHYLVVDPVKRLVIRHSRDGGDAIATAILRDGALRLDPPGLDVEIAAFFDRLRAAEGGG